MLFRSRICDPETLEEKEFGEEGEICVNGPTIMMGYLNNKEETDNMIRKHKDGKKWLHTGDLGYIAPNGIVYYTQRLKRMLIVSGFNVYPAQIEKTIEKHPLVEKCCVIGLPHQYKMQVPKAFIVLKNGTNPTAKIKKEIIEICKEDLSVYSLPKYYDFVESLPKTLYGKVDYKKLEKEEEKKNNK